MLQIIKSDIASQSDIVVQATEAFVGFLQGNRTTKIYPFLYEDDFMVVHESSDAGMAMWDQALGQSRDYYIFNNEVQLLARVVPELQAMIPYQSTLIELGVGSENAIIEKTLPMIATLKPQRVIVNDLSQRAVEAAAAIIKAKYPNLRVVTSTADFLDQQADIYAVQNAHVMILGSTISNMMTYTDGMPVNELAAHLTQIATPLGAQGRLIISQDTNQDEITLKKAYSTPSLHHFRWNVIRHLSAFLNVRGFDDTALVYEPMWDEQAYLFTDTFVNTRPQNITVNGHAISIPAGQRMFLSNCYKYPARSFQHIARIAGLKCTKTWIDHEDRVALHVLGKMGGPG